MKTSTINAKKADRAFLDADTKYEILNTIEHPDPALRTKEQQRKVDLANKKAEELYKKWEDTKADVWSAQDAIKESATKYAEGVLGEYGSKKVSGLNVPSGKESMTKLLSEALSRTYMDDLASRGDHEDLFKGYQKDKTTYNHGGSTVEYTKSYDKETNSQGRSAEIRVRLGDKTTSPTAKTMKENAEYVEKNFSEFKKKMLNSYADEMYKQYKEDFVEGTGNPEWKMSKNEFTKRLKVAVVDFYDDNDPSTANVWFHLDAKDKEQKGLFYDIIDFEMNPNVKTGKDKYPQNYGNGVTPHFG